MEGWGISKHCTIEISMKDESGGGEEGSGGHARTHHSAEQSSRIN